MQPESILAFKRLYVSAKKAVNEIETLFSAGEINEPLNEQAIADCDKMLSMLPIEFPTEEALTQGRRVLLVNLADPDTTHAGPGTALYDALPCW